MYNALDQEAIASLRDAKNKAVWRIRINGKVVMTRNGKSTWPGRGYAMNALRNHIRYCRVGGLITALLPVGHNITERETFIAGYIENLQQRGILEIKAYE